MPKALQHECPRWERTTESVNENDERYVWPGRIRIVHGQRARKLRKRGVPLMPLHAVRARDCSGRENEPTTPNGRARYAWFEPEAAVETRQRQRRLKCYVTATTKQPQGRKAWLAAQLSQQRAAHAARSYFRWMAKAFYGRYTMPMLAPYQRAAIRELWRAKNEGRDLVLHVPRRLGIRTMNQAAEQWQRYVGVDGTQTYR